MIVFCHLLNDRSGSPTVLRSTIAALAPDHAAQLYIGSQGRGVLEDTGVPLRRYWYRRSQHRLVTMVTFFASQIALYRALLRARDIPADATVFVNTLLPIGAMLWGRRSGRRVIVGSNSRRISKNTSPMKSHKKPNRLISRKRTSSECSADVGIFVFAKFDSKSAAVASGLPAGASPLLPASLSVGVA